MLKEVELKEINAHEDLQERGVVLNAQIPNWLVNFHLNHEKIDAELHGGIKYLSVEEQYFVESDSYTRYHTDVRQVFSMEGVEESAKIFVDFNPSIQTLNIHSITISAAGADSSIDKLATADFQILKREYRAEANILSGDVTLSIILDKVKVGDVIKLAYSITTRDKFLAKHFGTFKELNYAVSIGQINIALVAYDLDEFDYKIFGEPQQVMKINHLDYQAWLLDIKNIKATELKPYQPRWYHQLDFIQLARKQSWQLIAKEMSAFYQDIELYQKSIIDFLVDVKRQGLEPEKHVLKALDFIFDNVRYLANHAVTNFIRPSDPNLVVERLYGDCKDLTFLLKSLLSQLEIKAYPVLVNGKYGQDLKEFLPAASVFNHVILLIEYNGEKVFLDPTFRQKLTTLDKLYLPNFGYGLLCSADKAELVHVVNNNACRNHVDIVNEYRDLSKNGKDITFLSTVKLEGWPVGQFLRLYENESNEKIFSLLNDFYKKYIKVESVKLCSIGDAPGVDNSISYKVEYSVSIEQFFEKKGRFTYEFILMDMLEFMGWDIPDKLDTDFYFGIPFSLDYQVILKSKKISFSKLKDFHVKTDAFSISRKFSRKKKDKAVILDYCYKRDASVVKQKDYAIFAKNFQNLRNLMVFQISGEHLFKSIFSQIALYVMVLSGLCGFLSFKLHLDSQPTGGGNFNYATSNAYQSSNYILPNNVAKSQVHAKLSNDYTKLLLPNSLRNLREENPFESLQMQEAEK